MDDRFINRELSWIAFDERVLDLATEAGIPLIERAKFCAIATTNLDEFFQIRVAALKDQVAAKIEEPTPDGRTATQQLADIALAVGALVARQDAVYHDQLRPALAEAGVSIVHWSELGAEDRKAMTEVYEQRVFPVLTPLAVDPSHPFPYISDLALSVAAFVRDPETMERRFARVKVPDLLPRLVPIDDERFLPAEDLVIAHLESLFAEHDHRGGRVVPRHAQRRPHGGGGGGGRPARGGGDGAAPPPVQPRRAPRGRRRDQRRDARTARPRARSAPERRVPPARHGRLLVPLAAPGARPPRPQGPPVAADHAGAHRQRARGRAPDRVGDARPGDPRSPPLRELLHVDRGVHRAGGGRSAGAVDQDDAVPRRRRQPDHPGAHPRCRAGRAGGRARGAEGPLRRGDQRQLGQATGARRRPRRVRHGRAQDALEVRAGGARRR